MKIHFMYAEEGDWVGVYVDAKLVHEGHTIDELDLLDVLGIAYTTEECTFEDASSCPAVLERQLELPGMEKEPA